MAKHAAYGRILGISFLGLLVRDAEVARDSQNVALTNFDFIIAAAICRTLRAIEHHPQRSRLFL